MARTIIILILPVIALSTRGSNNNILDRAASLYRELL